MTRNAAIKLAKKALIKYANERYGKGAKYHEDKREEYDNYIEAAKVLESMKESEMK